MKEYFIHREIQFFTTRDPTTKAAICERFIRTIKGIIYKYFTYTKSMKYIDVLDSLTFLYNNRLHSSIGMSPCNVNESNVLNVWLYTQNREKRHTKIKKPNICVGDLVRVSNPKTTFEKGYKPKWSDEVFSIVRVLNRTPVVYLSRIKDIEGNLIKANFYETELQKIVQS